jgi:hypothetical protein
MLFRVENASGGSAEGEGNARASHCGVLEFVAEEGRAYLPRWVRVVLESRDTGRDREGPLKPLLPAPRRRRPDSDTPAPSPEKKPPTQKKKKPSR